MAAVTHRFRPAALLALLPIVAGACNFLGAAAAKAPRPDIEAAYTGLANHSVGVIVWADKSLVIDWPNMQLDMTNSILSKLKQAQDAKSKELIGTTFPWKAASFVKYQKEHPLMDSQPINDVAPKLQVDRLIYIEVNDFSTRADGAIALFLGKMDASMKVIEVTGDKGKAAYEAGSIQVQFPEKATKEGELNRTDREMYAGTVDSISTEIVTRLIQHPDDSP